MGWPTWVRERGRGAVLSWSVAQGWREDPCAELRSRQDCVGSAACGAQEGRSEPAEKWAAGLVLQQPDRSPFLLPSSCPPWFLQCPGTTAPHGHPQLWSLLRRGTRGRAQTKGAGTEQPPNGPGSSQASCEAGRAGWLLLAHDTAAFDVKRGVSHPLGV